MNSLADFLRTCARLERAKCYTASELYILFVEWCGVASPSVPRRAEVTRFGRRLAKEPNLRRTQSNGLSRYQLVGAATREDSLSETTVHKITEELIDEMLSTGILEEGIQILIDRAVKRNLLFPARGPTLHNPSARS